MNKWHVLTLIAAAIACFWFFDNIVNAIAAIFGLGGAGYVVKSQKAKAEAAIYDDTGVAIREDVKEVLDKAHEENLKEDEILKRLEEMPTIPKPSRTRKEWDI